MVITEPSTPEELEEEVKAIEEFIEAAAEELLVKLEEEEKEEPPAPAPEPLAPAPVVKNPDPVKQVGLARHRRNIPRFVRR